MCSPERDAIISDHHPLGGVEHQRISVFDTLQRPAQFWTQIRRPSIRSINVEPQLVFCTCIEKNALFFFFFKGTRKIDHIGLESKNLQTGPSSDKLSNAHTPVVPKVRQSWKKINKITNMFVKRNIYQSYL